MTKHPKILKHVLDVILILIFLYIILLINLFKATKKIEWNIFKSEALSYFLILSFVVIAIYIPVQFFWKKAKKYSNARKQG
jgi:hypothetical protein